MTTATAPSAGTFLGVDVTAGKGGGLASTAIAAGSSTHFHAARLPELGDVVLTVTRVFDEDTSAALRIELRAFAATAPGRGVLAEMPLDALMQAPGSLAVAELTLAAPGDEADERRPATLERCTVTDAAPTADAARRVADWLRRTWEVELSFGSWPAVRGSLDAFAHDGGAVADWALGWLVDGEHKLTGDGPDGFLKVLSPAWLEASGTADGQPDAATGKS